MNLAFNFQNKLFWIHNFLPEKMYKQMYINILKNRNKLNFKKSYVNWKTFDEEISDMSESLDQKCEVKTNYFDKYNTFLYHQPFVNILNCNLYHHLRKYSYGQHLAWQSDDCKINEDRVYAATFYFNKTWHESWGGELMFKSSEGSGFIPVVGNSLLIVKAGLKHKVNANLKKTHIRFSIQTWINKKISRINN